MTTSSYTIYKFKKEDLARVLYTLMKTVDLDDEMVSLFESYSSQSILYLAIKRNGNQSAEVCFESSLWRQKGEFSVELEEELYVDNTRGEKTLKKKREGKEEADRIIAKEMTWKVW